MQCSCSDCDGGGGGMMPDRRIREMRYSETRYTDREGVEHEAIEVPWWMIDDFLGNSHRGPVLGDGCLIGPAVVKEG